MRPSQRGAVLQAALRVVGSEEGDTITLDAVAKETGITKPGLMYHFPNREALMLAIVDHAAERLEHEMLRLLGTSFDESTPAQRVRAYVQLAANGTTSRAEWAVYVQAAYRPELAGPWVKRMSRWFALPSNLSSRARARLVAARMAADGLWTAEATGVLAPAPHDRDGLVAFITSLTESDQT